MSATAVSRTRSTDKRFYGVVEGLVTDVNDKDGKEGRVKVQFPWFDDQMETEWCRVRQFYAGNGYGAFFVPEVGDEVLVAFIHGDMRKPIILGGLYNGNDKPPSFRSDSQDQKMIRTKGNHELLFDDTSGKKKVQVKTAKGHVVLLDDDGQTVSVTSSGKHKVELDDGSGTVTVTSSSGGTMTLQNGTITIQGTTVNIEASVINLGSQAAVEQVMLGTSFMTIFNTHQHALSLPTMTTIGPPVPPMTPLNISTTTKAL
jgi:phage baseplate assembly protein V